MGLVEFEVTEDCNHKCLYCYNGDRHEQVGTTNYPEDRYLSITKKIIEIGTNSIVFTGGEPLLVIDKLWPSIDEAINHGIKVQINTNAVLLTPEIAKKLAERNVQLGISFISSDPDTFDKTTGIKGSFDRVVSGIQAAIDAGLCTGLNMVITKLNLYQIYDTAEFINNTFNTNKDNQVKSLAVTSAVVPAYLATKRDTIELTPYEQQMMFWTMLKVKERLPIKIESGGPTCLCQFDSRILAENFHIFTCVPGATRIAIRPDGGIKPCPSSSRVYDNIFAVNNVDRLLEDIIKEYTKRDAKCIDCQAFTQCYGGCPIQCEQRLGAIHKMCYEARPDKVPELIEKGIIQV